jgi:hypothetical protein
LALAGEVIGRFQGNLFDQFFNSLSGFFHLIPGRDFKRMVILNYLFPGKCGHCGLKVLNPEDQHFHGVSKSDHSWGDGKAPFPDLFDRGAQKTPPVFV